MKNYPFSFNQLKDFSESNPYLQLCDDQKALFDYLEKQRVSLHFPAVTDDIGSFLSFISMIINPKTIFEFGSGYGQSAFWFLRGAKELEKIILCEKRDDLVSVFESAPWANNDKSLIEYHQGDAFERLESLEQADMFLIDGVKADYLKFLKLCKNKISRNGLVIIDNSYWRGSFLDEGLSETKMTAKNIKELHKFIKESQDWDAVFIPFVDGLTLLRSIS
jgi:predicted O-methyltransferase YrrM